MKQFLTLFAAAFIGLLAASCNLEDVYTFTNADDIVTVQGDVLVSDFGTSYYITEDKTSSKEWKKDGTRMYAVFDVLNRSFEISLKEAHPFTVRQAEPLTVLDENPQDPVVVALQNVSGGHLNLALQIFSKKSGSEYPHKISIQYRQISDGDALELYVLHDGNNENPAVLPEDDLNKDVLFFTVPITDLVKPSTRQIKLTLDALAQNSEGKYIITRTTYQLQQNGYTY